MSEVRKKGDRRRYWVRDRDCLVRPCFTPGLYQVRGATAAGSRSTGTERPCCLENAYRGCPPSGDPYEQIRPELLKKRKAEGWKNV